VSVKVDKRGPLFDGRAEKAVADACPEIEKRVATMGASSVRSRLNSVLRTQTPFYRFRVVSRPDAPGWKVTDQAVIYGHWLEGDGSRNRARPGFPGYHTFQITTALMNARAQAMGDQVVAEYVRKMN
jgi:hypothetical protein